MSSEEKLQGDIISCKARIFNDMKKAWEGARKKFVNHYKRQKIGTIFTLRALSQNNSKIAQTK